MSPSIPGFIRCVGTEDSRPPRGRNKGRTWLDPLPCFCDLLLMMVGIQGGIVNAADKSMFSSMSQ